MEYSQEYLGQKIKEHRLASNMSQKDLADKSGLAKGYISSLELGKGRSISIKSLNKLATALNTDMDVLLSYSLQHFQGEKLPPKEHILHQLEMCSEKQICLFLQILQSFVELKHNQNKK